MPKRKDMKYWNIPVTPHLDNVLEKAVELNAHVSKSDLIRCAVREKLVAMGLKGELETIEKE
jgi:Arc/MetJ-type ribon-helix-helix transcriptional regulator